ncbi:MAG: RHS repeat protein, partial [Chthonomonas sp.]|nr:RHS repeat protein [Chthonomonas sp.]
MSDTSYRVPRLNAWWMRPTAFLVIAAMLSNPITAALQARKLDPESPWGVTRPNPGKYTGARQQFAKPKNGTKHGRREQVLSKAQREDLQQIHAMHRLTRKGKAGVLACMDVFSYVSAFSSINKTAELGGNMPWDGQQGGVNTNTGAFQTVVPIFGWPTKGGLTIDLNLIHNSRGDLETTEWGPNWKTNYDVYLNISGSTMYVEYADGTTAAFSILGNNASPPAGFYDTFSYNAGSSKWTMTDKGQSKYEFQRDYLFDPDWWFLTKITDRFGNTILVNRGDEGRLDSIVDGADSARKIECNASSFTFAPNGKTWTVTRGTNDRITNVQYPAPVSATGPSRTFTYSTSYGDRIATDTNLRGYTTSYTYVTSGAEEGAILTKSEPDSRVTTYSYPTDEDTVILDPNGSEVVHTYDATGQLYIVTDEVGLATCYAGRDGNGNVTQFLPGNFTELNYTYDGMGNMLTATDALYHTTAWTYNATNDLTSETNAGGKTWQYVYYGAGATAPGALEKVLDPLYASRTYPQAKYVYDAAGQVIELYDGMNLKVSYTRNSHGDVTTVTSPDGTYASLDYGSGTDYTKNVGLPYYSTSAAGITTGFKYDYWKRPTDIYVGDTIGGSHTGDHSIIAYDYEGNVTSVTDANGHATTFAYNNNDEVISTTNALNKTESYTRDDMGQVTEVVDRNGHTRYYEYTERGELRSITLPDHPTGMASEQWSFDPATGVVTAYT